MHETFISPVNVQNMHLQNHNDHAIIFYSAPKPSIYSQSLANSLPDCQYLAPVAMSDKNTTSKYAP